MILSYPYRFTTPSKYQVTVTNPEKYQYHFEVIVPNEDKISFDWFPANGATRNIRVNRDAQLNEVESEVLMIYWMLER